MCYQIDKKSGYDYCCKYHKTIHLYWILIPVQIYLTYQWHVNLTENLFYLMLAFFVIQLLINMHYFFHMDTDDAFYMLALGNILDRRYTRAYLSLLFRHWRIVYFGVSLSVAMVYLVDYIMPMSYQGLVAMDSLLLFFSERAPLYIRRQRFFEQAADIIHKSQKDTIEAVVENRELIKEKMRRKRGIKEIYLKYVDTESVVINNQKQIENHLHYFAFMTNIKLQYFWIIRYFITWSITNIIIRLLVSTYEKG